MPRLQVYLPDELHRREVEASADTYLAELIEEVGEPSAADVEYARRFVRDLTGTTDRQAG